MITNKIDLQSRLTAGWAGDKEALVSAYNSNCRFEDKALGLVHHDLQGIRDLFDYTFSIFPDFKVAYGSYIANSQYAAAEWVYTGSFHGELEGSRYDGIPVRIEGVSFMALSEGKINRNSDYWNLAELMQQLSK